jgi:hypothetical protein
VSGENATRTCALVLTNLIVFVALQEMGHGKRGVHDVDVLAG